jgi:uncharacterized phiE125 gp8 family phage protein
MLFTLTPSAPADGYGETLLPIVALKSWLRVDTNDEDDLIAALRDVGINAVEQYANLRIGPCAGLVVTFDRFGPRMRVGIGPAATVVVTGITYLDSSGASVVIAPGGWRVGQDGGIMPAIGTCWPRCGSEVAVTFNAGFPADTCPPGLITAAKMFAAHLYANREAVVTSSTSVSSSELPLGFTMLCDQHRMPVL